MSFANKNWRREFSNDEKGKTPSSQNKSKHLIAMNTFINCKPGNRLNVFKINFKFFG